jgi:hypothetical protein
MLLKNTALTGTNRNRCLNRYFLLIFPNNLEGNIKTSTSLIECQTHDSDRRMGSIDVNLTRIVAYL